MGPTFYLILGLFIACEGGFEKTFKSRELEYSEQFLSTHTHLEYLGLHCEKLTAAPGIN